MVKRMSYNLDGTLAGKATLNLRGEYFSNPERTYLHEAEQISGAVRPWVWVLKSMRILLANRGNLCSCRKTGRAKVVSDLWYDFTVAV
jgi:hypothetical protein